MAHTKGVVPINYFYWGVPLYFFVYLFLKHRNWSLLRLFVDFIFINIIVWGRNIDNPIPFLFVLLPIINAINFSGNRSHSIILMLVIGLTYFLHMKPFEFWIFLPLIALWGIYITSSLKRSEWVLINDISRHIDEYFIRKEEIQKPHLIYERIIKDLNNYFFWTEFSKKGISRIRSYALRGHTLWLIRSSSFIWDRKIEEDPTFIDDLRNKRVMPKKGEVDIQVFVYIKQGELEYVFICDIDTRLLLYNFFSLSYILEKSFSRVALLHDYEYKITELRNRKVEEIKNGVLYVNKAINIMHYIRNRMTPLKNLVTFHKKQKEMSDKTREEMSDYLSKLVEQADRDLKEILDTANYLLKKEKNPFVETELKQVRVSTLYIILSEIVERLLNGVVEAENSLRQEANSDLFVNVNITEMKIMFSDWLNNMSKYKEDFYSISMSIDQQQLIVCFQNDYDDKNDRFIRQLVKDINSTSKNAVLKGKNYGYGIHTIKSIADGLGIQTKAEINQDRSNQADRIILKLIFNTHGKEKDSDI
ncbi:hypothetical protein ACI76O_11605 [Capnocytophaga cynodegmi]|uniref:hypothetical protein n=1 Tax=Capnocytophaga cynodegmi TaxID=28189 RepID=UPI00385F077C